MSSTITNRFIFDLIICLCLLNGAHGNLLDYIWGKTEEVSTELKKLPSVPYELPDQDNEFLKEALKLSGTQTSELDSCQHRIIMKLNADCHKLNSEQMGKLAVMILNCQLTIEGRSSRMFPCTLEMSLKQCTIGMDSSTYNLYQTVMNRVQATCVSKRQEQFRGLSELTVNKLMKTAQDQLAIAKELLEGQIRLNEMSQDNIREIDENDVKIKSAQMQNLELSKRSKHMLETSLQELKKEQDLVNQIQNQLASSQDLLLHDSERISESLKDVISNLQNHNNKITENYEKTLIQLKEISGFIQYVEALKNFCDGFKKFVKEMGIDVESENFNVIAVNLLYLFFGMVLLNFLNASAIFKYIFVILIGGNIFAHVVSDGIPLLMLNNIFLTSWAMATFTKWMMKAFDKVKETLEKRNLRQGDSEDSDDEDDNRSTRTARTAARVERDRSLSPETTELINISRAVENESRLAAQNVAPAQPIRTAQPSISVLSVSALNTPNTSRNISLDSSNSSSQRPMTPAMSRVFNDSYDRSAAGTPFVPGMAGRIPCQALTQKGLPCKNAATVGFNFCRVHNK